MDIFNLMIILHWTHKNFEDVNLKHGKHSNCTISTFAQVDTDWFLDGHFLKCNYVTTKQNARTENGCENEEWSEMSEWTYFMKRIVYLM